MNSSSNWTILAQRIVRGLGVRSGELIQVRDDSGRMDILQEVCLAIEQQGAVPQVNLTSVPYMERLWKSAPESYLEKWDTHRRAWLEKTDRILVLAGADPDLSQLPETPFWKWREAEHRLTLIEEERQLPYLLTAVPTQRRAEQCNLSLFKLESLLKSALSVSIADLQRKSSTILNAIGTSTSLKLLTGVDCECTLHLAPQRGWLIDDGYIDERDRKRGAIVSNLPAGSIYTTVLEEKTSGSLFLPVAGEARDVRLTFENGRIHTIEAQHGEKALQAFFDNHSGEPRRVGHIGIGFNPALKKPIGWTLVDEHVSGSLFISFGENRYMGGENESSLNIDFAIPQATLAVNGRNLIEDGNLRVFSV